MGCTTSQVSDSMSVQLAVDMRSQPCRALAIFLKQTGIPHQLQNVDIFKGEHKTPEYTAKFPLNTVPGLADGDFYLGETVAIFRYLTTTYADMIEDHWYPKDMKARARVDAYMSFHHTGTRGKCIKVFINEVLGPMHGKPVDEESLKTDVENLKQGLDLIEKSFLKNTDFLCGNEVSIADIMAVCEFSQFIVNGRDIFQGHPKLKAYFDRVKARLNPAFDEMHSMIYSLRDSMKK